MDNSIIVALKNIVVDFDGEPILTGLSLDIHDKEFVTLLGPSGCGKTTTLRVIGGFVEPRSGNVFFAGRDITRLPPYKRQVNTVFQKYALFPHLNVFENVAFGLRLHEAGRKRDPRPVPGDAGAGGPEGLRAAQHGRALRRAAAAGGHRAGAGEPSEGASAGRAAGRAGPEAAQGYADRAQAHPAEPGHHLHLRHPRPGGGPHHVGHRRGDEPAATSSRSARPRISTTSRTTPLWRISSANPTSWTA